jgi:hypothetical protein
MILVVSVLIIITFVFGMLLGIIALIVSGIHADDRAKSLADPPRTCVEAATRRMLGAGARNANADSCEHGRE